RDGVGFGPAGRVGLLPLLHLVDGAGDLSLFLNVFDAVNGHGPGRRGSGDGGSGGTSGRGAAIVGRLATLGPQEMGLGAADERGSDQPGQTPLADLLPDHGRVPYSRLEVGSRAGFVTAAFLNRVHA